MCKIVMLINQDKTSETNNELASQFIKAQQKGLAPRSDGYSVYSEGNLVSYLLSIQE